jgi:hypothetical protein
MAFANITAFSTTALFNTGNTPGSPQQTGQILVFGGSNQLSALHEQKIFVVVLSCMCVSSPITGSYSVMSPLVNPNLYFATNSFKVLIIAFQNPR